MNTLYAVIMAGGEGKRMKSSVPKVLNKVSGEPMIVRIVKKVTSLDVQKILVVCGKYEKDIKQCIETDMNLSDNRIEIVYVQQYVPLGTGDAIKCCLPFLPHDKSVDVLIMNGDTPLIDKSIDEFVKTTSPCIMTTILDNPHGQGRIITNTFNGKFIKIVEEKDATQSERAITLVNCGVYKVSSYHLHQFIPQITNNNVQNEYYLTDICGMMQCMIHLYELPRDNQYELLNVNTMEDLHKAESILCESFFRNNNLNVRVLEEGDYYKGYLYVLSQLSDTVTIKSYDEFITLFNLINMNDNHIVYVIEDMKKQMIVANITLIIERKFIRGGKNVVHIEDVVVDSQYRKLNIGVNMISYIVSKSVSLDAYKIILDCKETLTSFYGKTGFTQTSVQMSKYF
jgi:NDP-sugar pyrophosphorylase family protein